MDRNSLKELIENVDYDDLKELKKEATRKLSSVRNRDRLFFRIYLQKEYVINFERALDWAFNKGLIKRKTRWAFAKFCITNVISMILSEIAKEQTVAVQSQTGVPLFPSEHNGKVRQN